MKKCRFLRVENIKKDTVYWYEVKEIIDELEKKIEKLEAEKEILGHKVKFLEGIIELNKQLKEMGK